jgi:putative hydrolase of the HAD superfamily
MRDDQLAIFDLDDTLVDTSDIYWRARTRFVEELAGGGYSSEEVLEIFEEIEDIHVATLGCAPDRYYRSMFETYCRLAEKSRHELCAETLGRIKEHGSMVVNHMPKVLEGAVPLLDWASEHFELALVTRGDKTLQLGKLVAAGLSKYFNFIEIVPTKNAAVFKRVMDETGYPSQKAWVIGDSIKTDINPGTKAGATCIQYEYRHDSYHWRQEHGHTAVGPFYKARTLYQVKNILESPSLFKKVEL